MTTRAGSAAARARATRAAALALGATALAATGSALAACAARPRAAAIDPVEKAMAAEEARAAAARRSEPEPEGLAPPIALFPIARARNVALELRDGAVVARGARWIVRDGELVRDARDAGARGPGPRAPDAGGAPAPRARGSVGAPASAQGGVGTPSPRGQADACWTATARAEDGAALAAGTRCATTVVIAERRTREEPRGLVDVLPGVEWKDQVRVAVTRVAARAADDLYVAATYTTGDGASWPYLARFDGEAWRAPPAPMRKPVIAALAPTPGGELWIVETTGREGEGTAARAAELWRRDAERRWRRVAMPAPRGLETPSTFVFRAARGDYEDAPREEPVALEPVDVAALGPGEALVLARFEVGDDDHWLVLATRQPPGGRIAALGEAVPTHAGAPGGACPGTWYVDLGPRPAGAFDFLSVRAALAGHREIEGATLVETIAAGARVHGVFVRTEAAAERVATLLARRKVATNARATCAAPRATRVLRFAVDTGDLLGD